MLGAVAGAAEGGGVSGFDRAAWNRRYRRTPRGFLSVTYAQMRARVRRKYPGRAICTLEQFIEWGLSQPSLITLLDRWRDRGYSFAERPSIDRIDAARGYELGNMQFLTVRENSRKGQTERGEPLRGSQIPWARFNEDQVRAMRVEYSKGKTPKQISDEYGAPKDTIRSILSRRTWRHVA